MKQVIFLKALTQHLIDMGILLMMALASIIALTGGLYSINAGWILQEFAYHSYHPFPKIPLLTLVSTREYGSAENLGIIFAVKNSLKLFSY